MERMIDLAVPIRAYRINDAIWMDQQLQYYAGLALEDAIRKAAFASRTKSTISRTQGQSTV